MALGNNACGANFAVPLAHLLKDQLLVAVARPRLSPAFDRRHLRRRGESDAMAARSGG